MNYKELNVKRFYGRVTNTFFQQKFLKVMLETHHPNPGCIAAPSEESSLDAKPLDSQASHNNPTSSGPQ